MDELLTDFFNKNFETIVNSRLQEFEYEFHKNDMLDYIRQLNSLPIQSFLEYLDSHPFFSLESLDMPQISSFRNAFYEIVEKMIDKGDPGLRFVSLGQLLLNDGKPRSECALRKYGENHAKAAEYLGFLYSLNYYYYVSCYGYVVSDLSELDKDCLFARLLLRTNLFRAIYAFSKQGNVSLRFLFDFLSDQTYQRRVHGTRIILNQLKTLNDYTLNALLNKIDY